MGDMMTDQQHYTKLNSAYLSGPGCLFGLLSRTRLFLGKDHLLFATNSIIKEEYRRVYFRDIQMISMQVTGFSRLLHFILIFLVLGLGIREFVNDVPFGFSGAFLIVTIIYWLVHWGRGETCACEVRTRVQSLPLPIGRLKSAKIVLDLIRERTSEVQGSLEGQIMRGGPAGPDKKSEPIPPIRRGMQNSKDMIYMGHSHGLLAGGWFFLAISSALVFLNEGLMFLYPMLLSFSCIGIFSILSIANQRRAEAVGVLGSLTWVGIFIWALQAIVVYIYFIRHALMNPEIGMNPAKSYISFFEAVGSGQGGTEYLVPGLMGTSAAMGVLILVAWFLYRQRAVKMSEDV